MKAAPPDFRELPVAVRPAVRSDLPEAIRLMRQLAAFEGHEASFAATPERLAEGLFGAGGGLRCWVAEVDGDVVGVALCATTWVGITSRPSLRLLNLVVDHRARRAQVGSSLMVTVAGACVELDCALDWMVRSDNIGALRFYERLGATVRSGWQPWQLSAEGCRRLAEVEPSPQA